MSNATNRFSTEGRERAVRMVLGSQCLHGSRWQAIASGAATIRCSVNTPNAWVKKAEADSGKRARLPCDMVEKMNALERENRGLFQANDILRKTSAYFAMAEFGRRSK